MNKFIVHLGLHKTGSTLLQKAYFPRAENCSFIGRKVNGGFYGDALYKSILKYCCSPTEPQALKKQEIIQLIENHLLDQNLILSDEWLTSNYDGFFHGDGTNWKGKLKRLLELINNIESKIIVVEREPVEAAFSLFCEFKKIPYGNKWASLEDFILYSEDPLVYSDCIPFLRPLLSEKNTLHTLKYSLLKNKPEVFINDLNEITGLKIFLNNQKINARTKKGDSYIVSSFPSTLHKFRRAILPLARKLPFFFGFLRSAYQKISKKFETELVIKPPTIHEVENYKKILSNRSLYGKQL